VLTQLPPGRNATLHEQSRRLFLDKSELHYTTELRRGTSSQLVLTFAAPVNPSIATEQGKLRMRFHRDPVVATTGLENVRFEDRTFSSLSYSEGNGAAELLVSGTASLTASFGPDRRVITISAVQRPSDPIPVPVPVPPINLPQAPQPVPSASELVVVIDPAHGGEDSGGVIADKLREKDVTLTFARTLYRELDSLGIAARLVRDGDTPLAPEQRAVMTNAISPSLYIALHASASGGGVYIFTSRLKPMPRTSGFQPWDTAQSASVITSQAVATSIATELLKHDVPGVALTAALRPLNNVASPAVAVEVASPQNVDKLTSQQYQETVCKSIAAAVANSRARLMAGGAGR
jgi:N-acetylmuramoyl-L-alanine amidase